MYENSGSMTGGVMKAGTWGVEMTKEGMLNDDELSATLENAVKQNAKTIINDCHLANTCSNLSVLGKMFDQYPNLYADIAARYGEISPIPRYVHAFMEKYANRLVYGTDMGISKDMYKTTFRILETADEHFYNQ